MDWKNYQMPAQPEVPNQMGQHMLHSQPADSSPHQSDPELPAENFGAYDRVGGPSQVVIHSDQPLQPLRPLQAQISNIDQDRIFAEQLQQSELRQTQINQQIAQQQQHQQSSQRSIQAGAQQPIAVGGPMRGMGAGGGMGGGGAAGANNRRTTQEFLQHAGLIPAPMEEEKVAPVPEHPPIYICEEDPIFTEQNNRTAVRGLEEQLPLPYRKNNFYSWLRYQLLSIIVSRPRLYTLLLIIKSIVPRAVVVVDVYTDLKVIFSLYKNAENAHSVNILLGTFSSLIVSLPFVVVWISSLRFIHRYVQEFQERNANPETRSERYRLKEWMINFGLILYLFPPLGCLLIAMVEVFWACFDIYDALRHFILGRIWIVNVDRETHVLKQFRKVVEFFGESIPQTLLQVYMFYRSVKVSEQDLIISLIISTTVLLYNIWKLQREAHFHGMSFAEYAMSVIQLCEIPLIKLVPRLPGIRKGKVKTVNFANFKMDKQSLAPIFQALASPQSALTSFKISLRTIKSLDYSSCRLFGEQLHKYRDNVSIIISRAFNSESILKWFKQMDRRDKGYITYAEFEKGLDTFNTTLDRRYYKAIFERLAIRRKAQRDRVFFYDFFQNLTAFHSRLDEFDMTQIMYPAHYVIPAALSILSESINPLDQIYTPESIRDMTSRKKGQTIHDAMLKKYESLRKLFHFCQGLDALSEVRFPDRQTIFMTLCNGFNYLETLRKAASTDSGKDSKVDMVASFPTDLKEKIFDDMEKFLWELFDRCISQENAIDTLHLRDVSLSNQQLSSQMQKEPVINTRDAQVKAVKHLQESGIVNINNMRRNVEEGLNALELAAAHGQSRVFAHLLEASLSRCFLHPAYLYSPALADDMGGYKPDSEQKNPWIGLLQYVDDTLFYDEQQRSPLYWAVRENLTKTIDMYALIQSNLDPKSPFRNKLVLKPFDIIDPIFHSLSPNPDVVRKIFEHQLAEQEKDQKVDVGMGMVERKKENWTLTQLCLYYRNEHGHTLVKKLLDESDRTRFDEDHYRNRCLDVLDEICKVSDPGLIGGNPQVPTAYEMACNYGDTEALMHLLLPIIHIDPKRKAMPHRIMPGAAVWQCIAYMRASAEDLRAAVGLFVNCRAFKPGAKTIKEEFTTKTTKFLVQLLGDSAKDEYLNELVSAMLQRLWLLRKILVNSLPMSDCIQLKSVLEGAKKESRSNHTLYQLLIDFFALLDRDGASPKDYPTLPHVFVMSCDQSFESRHEVFNELFQMHITDPKFNDILPNDRNPKPHFNPNFNGNQFYWENRMVVCYNAGFDQLESLSENLISIVYVVDCSNVGSIEKSRVHLQTLVNKYWPKELGSGDRPIRLYLCWSGLDLLVMFCGIEEEIKKFIFYASRVARYPAVEVDGWKIIQEDHTVSLDHYKVLEMVKKVHTCEIADAFGTEETQPLQLAETEYIHGMLHYPDNNIWDVVTLESCLL